MTEIIQPPLKLIQSVYEQIEFRALPTFDSSKQSSINLEFEAALPVDSDKALKKEYSVILSVRCTGKDSENPPYLFHITIAGKFTTDDEQVPGNIREDMLRKHGGSMLYGQARELLLLLTSRASYGPINLPSVKPIVFASSTGDKNPVKKENPKSN